MGHSKGGRKRSLVWQFFTDVSDEDSTLRKGQCSACGKVLSGNPERMLRHIMNCNAASEEAKLLCGRAYEEDYGEKVTSEDTGGRDTKPTRRSSSGVMSSTIDGKGGRKRSRVWEYFVEVENDNKRYRAKCRFCDVEFASNATRMLSHVINCQLAPPKAVEDCEVMEAEAILRLTKKANGHDSTGSSRGTRASLDAMTSSPRLKQVPSTRTVPADLSLLKPDAPAPLPRDTDLPPCAIVDASDFTRLNQEMAVYDEQRDTIIKQSRDVNKSSKHAIYLLHQEKYDEAQANLEKAETAIAMILNVINQQPSLRQGSFSNAMEEYAEAKCFQQFLLYGTLLPSHTVPSLTRNEYLGGVLDLTGEIARYAVLLASKRKVDGVKQCRELVDAIDGQFIQLPISTPSLQKKLPALKMNLRKIETTLYELSLLPNDSNE